MALKYLYVPSGYKAGTAYGVLPNDSTADFDNFSRPSFATRTNKDGLLETYQTFGNNLVTNGDFATDSNWVKSSSSITILGGKANFSNTSNGNTLRQDNFLTEGKRYEVSFTVSNYTEGSVRVGRPFFTPSVNSNGVHTVTGIATADGTGGSDDLQFQAIGETTLSIDDVSVKEVALNVPRIDYSDGGCPSLLLEAERTNLAKYSEQITLWNKNPSNGTVTVRENEQVSPDGENSADVVSVLTQYDGVHTQSITSVTNTKYSCSAYVKHVSGSSKIRVGITSGFNSGTGSKYVRFDLSNGSIILNELDGEADFKSVYVGNGWYRLIIENCTGYGSSSHFVVYSYEDGLTEFSVWGGQIEVGSFTSSYIPNLWSGTTTRNGDAGNWAANFDGMNSFEGVLEARFKAFDTDVSNRITLGTNVNGDNHNRLSIGYSISGGVVKPFVIIVYDGGGTELAENQSVSMPSSFNIFEYNTYKFKFKAGNNELKINGEVVTLIDEVANLDFSFGGVLESVSLNLFGSSTSYRFYGGLKHIKVYDSITDF